MHVGLWVSALTVLIILGTSRARSAETHTHVRASSSACFDTATGAVPTCGSRGLIQQQFVDPTSTPILVKQQTQRPDHKRLDFFVCFLYFVACIQAHRTHGSDQHAISHRSVKKNISLHSGLDSIQDRKTASSWVSAVFACVDQTSKHFSLF